MDAFERAQRVALRAMQAGHVRHYKSVRTGKRRTMAERAYCQGFVRPHEADEILRWMWAHTDKYAVKKPKSATTQWTIRYSQTLGRSESPRTTGEQHGSQK